MMRSDDEGTYIFSLVDQNTLDYCYSETGASPRTVCARLVRQPPLTRGTEPLPTGEPGDPRPQAQGRSAPLMAHARERLNGIQEVRDSTPLGSTNKNN